MNAQRAFPQLYFLRLHDPKHQNFQSYAIVQLPCNWLMPPELLFR
jgi:hypothetical protein